MENLIPELNLQDFFEVYKLLVKTELLENIALVSESLILERFTQDLMSYVDESSDSQNEDKDIFPKTCKDPYNNIISQAPQVVVEFMDLKGIYKKFQSRAGGGSRQRITSGLINIRTTSEGQLCDMNVFVQRTPEAAALCGDVNGRIPLDVNHEGYFQNQQYFLVDLDSVYDTPDGTPVYKLATVEAERRNVFHLVVFLRFVDGTESGPFISKPFLLQSKKTGNRSNSFDMQ